MKRALTDAYLACDREVIPNANVAMQLALLLNDAHLRFSAPRHVTVSRARTRAQSKVEGRLHRHHYCDSRQCPLCCQRGGEL